MRIEGIPAGENGIRMKYRHVDHACSLLRFGDCDAEFEIIMFGPTSLSDVRYLMTALRKSNEYSLINAFSRFLRHRNGCQDHIGITTEETIVSM